MEIKSNNPQTRSTGFYDTNAKITLARDNDGVWSGEWYEELKNQLIKEVKEELLPPPARAEDRTKVVAKL